MKRFCKRIAALTVCLTLVFSVFGSMPVHAAAQKSDEPSANLFYLDDASLQCSVLIFCWYSNLHEQAACLEGSTVGETPDVTLEYTDADGAAKTIAIEKDGIVQEVYTWEPFEYEAIGQAMPQLTVCLPVRATTLPRDTRVTVSAGASEAAGADSAG